MLRIVYEMEKPNNLYARPMDRTKEAGIAGRKQGTGWRGKKGKNWDNCNSIINKIYLNFKKQNTK